MAELKTIDTLLILCFTLGGMNEQLIRSEHKHLLGALVIDRRINDEDFLHSFKQRLSRYSNLSRSDLSKIEMFSGFTPEELLFAVSLLETIQENQSPSPEYLDKLIKDTARWMNTRSTLKNIESNSFGKYLGSVSTKVSKDVRIFEFELRSMLSFTGTNK